MPCNLLRVKPKALWLYEIAIVMFDRPSTVSQLSTSGNYEYMLQTRKVQNIQEYYEKLGERITNIMVDTKIKKKKLSDKERELAASIYDGLQNDDGTCYISRTSGQSLSRSFTDSSQPRMRISPGGDTVGGGGDAVGGGGGITVVDDI